jgi:hypothetical protein
MSGGGKWYIQGCGGETYYLEVLGMDGRIILNWIIKKWNGGVD